MLAADCEKDWLHAGWEDTMQKWYDWLEDEKCTKEKSAKWSRAWMAVRVFLHRITMPTAWRGGVQIFWEEEEDARPTDRCEEKRKAM